MINGAEIPEWEKADTDYKRALDKELISRDELQSAYENAKRMAKESGDPVADKVRLLEIQSKLSMGLSFILFAFFLLMAYLTFAAGYVLTNVFLAVLSLLLSTYM